MSEKKSHAFIVRVWVEPREILGASPQWRGSVQEVFSGEQRYFDSFEQMIHFMVRKAKIANKKGPTLGEG